MNSADIFILLYVYAAAIIKMEGGSALGVGCDRAEGKKINVK